MSKHEITTGKGRGKISLSAENMGGDIVAFIYNENAHIGAVAVGEYNHIENRTSVSVITRSGHKDDAIAREAAYLISKHTKKPSCVIAGIHLDDITDEEIREFLENADFLVKDFLRDEKKKKAMG